MDPIVIAAGTAVVKAMATEVWSAAKAAVVRWWRKSHPEQAERVSADLDQLRAEVMAARAAQDTATEDALAGMWRLRLQHAIAGNPALRAELERLLHDELTPRLSVSDQSTVAAISQTANARGRRNTIVQAGRDAHVEQPPAAGSS
ncbi:hypothetical protein BJY24_004601 [Nocardia transvalensis]|uniref:Uncharacterized protein n=1 Tax=Nocardia transvalensis TaxID=37333 RepID=A0A7W9PHE3_9NOCA|nr:hypothetical protein [Nocardia transvalensis]MBB5915689.1 hypothetical protein [Nocardia transvalensis]